LDQGLYPEPVKHDREVGLQSMNIAVGNLLL
jgi:hypothetical protein